MINYETMSTDFASKPHPTKLYTIQPSLLQIWVKSVSDFSSYSRLKVFKKITPSTSVDQYTLVSVKQKSNTKQTNKQKTL